MLEMSLRRARLSGRRILDMADLPTVSTQNTGIIGRECQRHHMHGGRLGPRCLVKGMDRMHDDDDDDDGDDGGAGVTRCHLPGLAVKVSELCLRLEVQLMLTDDFQLLGQRQLPCTPSH